jgi:hypothetical protein
MDDQPTIVDHFLGPNQIADELVTLPVIPAVVLDGDLVFRPRQVGNGQAPASEYIGFVDACGRHARVLQQESQERLRS